MSVSKKIENGILTIGLSGRIDSVNANDVEEEIEAIRAGAEYESVVLDLDELEYTSSAGLRVILRLRKKEPTLEVVNASSEVYEVFEMTGFTEMIPVKKAYRKLSVEGCEVIGEGANGKVYRIDRDTIVKVYLNPDSLPDIQRERELARRAFVLGVPTAIPYDIVRVGAGYGSVFELLNAQPLAKLAAAEPEKIDHFVDLNVELLKTIHSTEVKPEDMPDMRDVAIGWAEFDKEYLPAEIGEKLVKLVTSVPVDHHMMHGDYHIKNVMMQNGEALLIDMDTLCQGHPIFELGSMFNAYVGFFELIDTDFNTFMGMPKALCWDFWKKSLKLYLGTDDSERYTEVENKAKIIGYMRLMRRLIRRHGLETEEGRNTIEFYKKNLTELVSAADTLLF